MLINPLEYNNRGCIKLKFFKLNLIQPIFVIINFIHIFSCIYFQILVLCQEKVQIKFGQIVFVINMHFLHFLNSTYFHIHLEINIHNGCVFLLYYRMFLYIQKQVHMHVCNLKFYNDLTTLF